jgi:hypothetical protein
MVLHHVTQIATGSRIYLAALEGISIPRKIWGKYCLLLSFLYQLTQYKELLTLGVVVGAPDLARVKRLTVKLVELFVLGFLLFDGLTFEQ